MNHEIMAPAICIEIFDSKSALVTRLSPGTNWSCGIGKAFINIPGKKGSLIELSQNESIEFSYHNSIYNIKIYSASGALKSEQKIDLSNQKPDKTPTQICRACDGKGEYVGLGYSERPCKTCNGFGKV